MSYPRRIPLGHPVRRGGAILALTLALAACGEGGSPAGTIEVDGSFARIVNEVLSPSCATSGCHVSGSGQVALSGAGAYDALVNATPTHPGARLAGLKRVVPGRPDSSLLYLRLLAPTHPLPIDLGPVMPEGRAPLTAGQVEYLLQLDPGPAARRTGGGDRDPTARRALHRRQALRARALRPSTRRDHHRSLCASHPFPDAPQ